jgi:transitional endoplasmic reticulum ATPase
MTRDERFLHGHAACFLIRLIKENRLFHTLESYRYNNLTIIDIVADICDKEDIKKMSKVLSFHNNKDKIKIEDEKKTAKIIEIIENIEKKENLLELINLIKQDCSLKAGKYIEKVLTETVLKILKRKKRAKYIECNYSKKLKELCATFNLNRLTEKIILFLSVQELISSFKKLDTELSDFSEKFNYSKNLLKIILSPSNDSTEYILDKSDFPYRMKLSFFTEEYLFSNDSNNVNKFFQEYKGNNYPLNSFNLDEATIETLKFLIKKDSIGTNILIYGAPGTGKTELTKALAKECNKNLYFINEEIKKEKKHQKESTRLANFHACINSVDPKTSLIVFDEADNILNTERFFPFKDSSKDKSIINKLLESIKHKVIWISNKRSSIEHSVLRRFDFSLQFKQNNKLQRLKMWKSIIEEKKLSEYISKEEIEQLSETYKINISGIAQAIKAIDEKVFKEDKNYALKIVNSLLENHQKLIFENNVQKTELNSHGYNLNSLNIDQDPHETKKILRSFFENKNPEIKNMNILLSGPPGTGKTEYAKFLAKSINKDIVSVTASQLMNKYVGETEKNIRNAFDEAEKTDSILFIDEADSFFTSRENARVSWEVTKTNELLCQMEKFKGVLICATNFKENLDAASIRRFNIKINFNYLKEEGKFTLYQKILGNLKPINTYEEDLINNELKKIDNLTPGDFKVVYQKNFYLKEIEHKKLIEDLIIETKHKEKNLCQRKIGFNY